MEHRIHPAGSGEPGAREEARESTVNPPRRPSGIALPPPSAESAAWHLGRLLDRTDQPFSAAHLEQQHGLLLLPFLDYEDFEDRPKVFRLGLEFAVSRLADEEL